MGVKSVDCFFWIIENEFSTNTFWNHVAFLKWKDDDDIFWEIIETMVTPHTTAHRKWKKTKNLQKIKYGYIFQVYSYFGVHFNQIRFFKYKKEN